MLSANPGPWSQVADHMTIIATSLGAWLIVSLTQTGQALFSRVLEVYIDGSFIMTRLFSAR